MASLGKASPAVATSALPLTLLSRASNGLQVRDGLPLDEWVALGRRISTIANASGWWLGDWLLYGQRTYRDRYKTAIAATELDYQTLRNCAWVAHKFDLSRRCASLSFNHHAEVASLSEPEQDLWLARADRHGWSRNELRRRVSAARRLARGGGGGGDEDGGVVTLDVPITSDRERRWRDAASAAGQDLGEWMATTVDAAAEALLRAQ